MTLTFAEEALIREALTTYYDTWHEDMDESEIKAYNSLIKKL